MLLFNPRQTRLLFSPDNQQSTLPFGYHPAVKTFQDRIREELSKSARPLAEIARAAGIHRVAVSRFKHGATGLNPESLDRLAKTLGFRIELTAQNKSRRAKK